MYLLYVMIWAFTNVLLDKLHKTPYVYYKSPYILDKKNYHKNSSHNDKEIDNKKI